jgi:sulfite reductase (NADPH) flavoprotein alpha-component
MSDVPTPAPFNRKNPFPAPLLVNRPLNAPGSEKDTRHYELSLAGSGLRYECGDSLGIFVKNCPELVEEILQALRVDPDELVPGPDADSALRPLREALLSQYVIKEPNRPFLQLLCTKAGPEVDHIRDLLLPEHREELAKYLYGLEYIDLLLEFPHIRFTAEEFAATLRKLQPRLYSIASSQRAYPDTVHLTIGTVRYRTHGRQRKGVASTWMADRVPTGSAVPSFVHVAKGFRLPENPEAPVIMVGPGTGIAPFRAFLQERRITGALGKNWLFFGEQRSATDFLYREEFEALQREGVLSRLDAAFSRDQAHKVYVQHRMLENAAELWRWIDAEGACFYVCGDASRMAKDVDAALRKIIETAGGKSPEEAVEYVEKLHQAKRYRRDVY